MAKKTIGDYIHACKDNPILRINLESNYEAKTELPAVVFALTFNAT